MSSNRERLKKLIEKNCLLTAKAGEKLFTLSTGEKSRFYFDCKRVTLDGEGLSLIAKEFLAEIKKLGVSASAIGGLTMGADFMTAAVIAHSYEHGGPITKGSIARKEPKQHGTQNTVENELERGTKIVVVDDVVTTGTSTI